MLCSACSTMGEWRETVDKSLASASVAIEKAKAGVEVVDAKITEVKAALDAKVDAAKAELAAKGAPVDGTPSELWEWAKDNPTESFGSLGALATLFTAMILKYRTARSAVAASVDGLKALPPDAQAAFKEAAARSPHMGAAEAALVAEVKNR